MPPVQTLHHMPNTIVFFERRPFRDPTFLVRLHFHTSPTHCVLMRLLILDIDFAKHELAYILYDTQTKRIVHTNPSIDAKHHEPFIQAAQACDVIVSHGAQKDQQALKLSSETLCALKPWLCTCLLPWGVKPKTLKNICEKLGVSPNPEFSAFTQCDTLLNCLLQFDIDSIVKLLLLNK